MLLANATLPDGRRADVHIVDGLIASITAPGLPPADLDRRDLAGALLLPAFIDGHIHLDKTHMGAPLVPHVPGESVRERIAAERVARHAVPLPVEARATNLLRRLVANGTTRVRSHVDIDNDVKLANLEALLAVRERWRPWADIEIVAFPQSGVVSEPGAAELLDAALAAGADLIGGLDPEGFDHDIPGQLDIVFALAEKHGKGIDIHLHDGGETGGAELRDIASRAEALGLQGRVVVSHAFSLGDQSPESFASTADALARAGVAIMTSSPAAVPVPPVKALRRHGVTLFAASDNIRDCWSPFGNGDMLDRAAIVASRQEFYANDDLRLALDLATVEPARALGITGYGLVPGAPADLVVIDTPSVEEAVINRPPRKLVLRGGVVAAENGVVAEALPA
ncbi:amidohydrolase [Labrys neptuniae]|uniref:Amidohydrolase n=1 Tax=Labrys neptuniae TaxID=376174 RepID=A0ABV3PEW2_9HYPH